MGASCPSLSLHRPDDWVRPKTENRGADSRCCWLLKQAVPRPTQPELPLLVPMTVFLLDLM